MDNKAEYFIFTDISIVGYEIFNPINKIKEKIDSNVKVIINNKSEQVKYEIDNKSIKESFQTDKNSLIYSIIQFTGDNYVDELIGYKFLYEGKSLMMIKKPFHYY